MPATWRGPDWRLWRPRCLRGEEEVNEVAGDSIRSDKEWEAQQGFIRGWVAHIFHMKTAADPVQAAPRLRLGTVPGHVRSRQLPGQHHRSRTGPITTEGSRRNARMLIEYVEGWLQGRGSKGHRQPWKVSPGVHPALMEDLATGRISVAQTAQRIVHGAKDENTGQMHDFALIKQLLQEELADIFERRTAAAPSDDASPGGPRSDAPNATSRRARSL